MRRLGADAFWLLVAATVATYTAALWTQSSLLRVVGSLLATLVVVVLTRWAIVELRRWGARPAAVVLVATLGVLAVALQIAPLVLEMDWVRASLIVVAWGGLLIGYVSPELVVRVTGGPRAAWSLLRERAVLWNDVRNLTDEQFAAAGDAIAARVRGLDRYRTPQTTAYIDAFQRLALADEPAEAKEQQAARLSELESELMRSLGPSPAWTAELGGAVPNH